MLQFERFSHFTTLSIIKKKKNHSKFEFHFIDETAQQELQIKISFMKHYFI